MSFELKDMGRRSPCGARACFYWTSDCERNCSARVADLFRDPLIDSCCAYLPELAVTEEDVE